MSMTELLIRMDHAVREEDIEAVQELLTDVRGAVETRDKHIEELREQVQALQDELEALEQQTAWRWLRSNQPESYEQLLRKLGLARENVTTQNPWYELGYLIDIFRRCEELHIPLLTLGIPENLGKYREAVAHLRGLGGDDLREALQEVRHDANRDATRERVRRRY